jgi:hypothetical protein
VPGRTALRPRRVLIVVVIVVVATLASLTAAGPTAGAASLPGAPVEVADATGDVAIDNFPYPQDPIDEPRADLTSASIQIGPSELQVAATVAQFTDPTQDFSWTHQGTWTELRWWIDATADGRFDYLVIYLYQPINQLGLHAVMADTRTGRSCPGRPSFDAAARRYVASFALSCTTARQMRVLARMDRDRDPWNHSLGTAFDFALDQPNWSLGSYNWSDPAVRVGVRADRPAVFRSGTWYLRSGVGSTDRTIATFRFGIAAGDIPIFCDWDGDGDRTPGVFRAGVWYIRNSNTGPVVKSFTFGRAGDRPVCGNWPPPGSRSPGADHPGVYRAGVWYLRYLLSSGPANHSLRWGGSLSKPVVGDWDGDGWDQPGLYRAGRWQLLDTFWSLVDLSKIKSFSYGQSGDVPVVGDWNRDGLTTVGVKRGTKWYVSNALGSPTSSTFSYGLSTDRPVIWR